MFYMWAIYFDLHLTASLATEFNFEADLKGHNCDDFLVPLKQNEMCERLVSFQFATVFLVNHSFLLNWLQIAGSSSTRWK